MFKIFDGSADFTQQDHEPFTFSHRVSEHPALELSNLANIIPTLATNQVFYSARQMEKGDDFFRSISDGRKEKSVQEVFEDLPHSNSYIMLREPEKHPSLKDLQEALVDDVTRSLKKNGLGNTPIDPRSYIFISSPNTTTPFHYDRASNFLLQIKGSKAVTVFPAWNEQVIEAQEYESHMEYNEGAVAWDATTEKLGKRFECKQGDALHIPFAAGHHVENGPEVSVTLSVFFNNTRTYRQINALKYNHRARKGLKKLGLSPVPVGRNHAIDSMKALAYRAYARAVR